MTLKTLTDVSGALEEAKCCDPLCTSQHAYANTLHYNTQPGHAQKPRKLGGQLLTE